MSGAAGAPPAPVSAAPPAIEVRGLVKRFNGVAAVDGVTFTVPRGEIFGFLGPNGAGKTTTIRMLAALLEPDGGEARIAGHSVWDAPERVRAAIGFMPDDFGVYPGLRVDEYLDFFAAASRTPREARQGVIEAVLELTGLDAIRTKQVQTLSRGMRQRLGLGRALVHEPDVLLLDEPASGLDPRARIEMRELLLELARMGKTILVSSHILTEMSELCTTIGIIERGQLLAAGTPTQILTALTPARRIRITLLDRREEAVALLNGINGVSGAEVLGNEVRVVFDGEEAEIVRLLKPLADGGFPITAVIPESADLERIFLRVTKGDLA